MHHISSYDVPLKAHNGVEFVTPPVGVDSYFHDLVILFVSFKTNINGSNYDKHNREICWGDRRV